MGRSTELLIPVEETYRDILRRAIEEVGTQREVGRLAGVHQTTVGRAIERGAPVTYTTLVRLSRVLPGVPDPVVAVRDEQHELWCRLGAHLQEHHQAAFGSLLSLAKQSALSGSQKMSDDSDLDRLKEIVANPVAKSVPVKLAHQSPKPKR